MARARAEENSQTSNTTNTQTTQQQQTGNPATLHCTPQAKKGAVRGLKRESAVATWQACMERHKERTQPHQRQHHTTKQRTKTTGATTRQCPGMPANQILKQKTHGWPGKAHCALTVRDEVPLLSDLRSNPQSKRLKLTEDCSPGSANRSYTCNAMLILERPIQHKQADILRNNAKRGETGLRV